MQKEIEFLDKQWVRELRRLRCLALLPRCGGVTGVEEVVADFSTVEVTKAADVGTGLLCLAVEVEGPA